MSYHQDWLMQQIEAITATLKYVISGKKEHIVAEDIQAPTPMGDDGLYLQLQALVRQGNICEAEDLLYELMEEPDSRVLDAARRFYEDLNRLSDETLRQCNFSREEILEGLQNVCGQFGIPI